MVSSSSSRIYYFTRELPTGVAFLLVGEANPTGGLEIIAYDQASIGIQIERQGDQVRKRKRERSTRKKNQ